MNDQPSKALEVALAYFKAWTSKDLDRAMSYIADDIICDAPAGRIEGAAAYIATSWRRSSRFSQAQN